MIPRASWKGYLRLSLVSCPVLLFPAIAPADKTRFHQINRRTGNRIKMQRVDAETGNPVEFDDIVKGFEISKDRYVEVTREELEDVALESTRTVEIDQFVPRDEIDDVYKDTPYYIVPDGDVGVEAYSVIREGLKRANMVALGRVVLATREHVMAIEPRGKGLLGITLRYPYELRKEKDYFGAIPDVKLTKDMLDLAVHIVTKKTGHFDPGKFRDRYEEAIRDLLKRKGEGKRPVPKREPPAKVINLLDALRRSAKTAGYGSLKAHEKKVSHAHSREHGSRKAG